MLRSIFVGLVLLGTALGVPCGALGAATRWNAGEAGADAGGQADATPVFQKLLDEAAAAGGGVVDVPAGRYRIAGNLSVPANVTLQGTFRGPPTPTSGAHGPLNGSTLLAYAGRGVTNGTPFIRLAGHNAGIAGLIIAYPEWKQTDVPPVPYPPCVLGRDVENVTVQDCCLLNPYEAIVMVRAARHLIRNVTGYPIKRGVFVDECYDIGHIENVHFWPFGVAYQPEDPFCKWVNTQGTAFELARTDWHYVHNTFCFGYGVGYKFSKSRHGSANGNFLGLGADSCERAVVVEQAQPPGLLICNGEFVGRWSSTNSVCLEVLPEAEGKVSLVNCSFWGPIDRCVWMRASAGQFTADACHFVDWDNAAIGSPAIHLDAGKAIIQASTFNRSKLHVAVSSNVVSAILTANQAEGGFRVRNAAGRRVQLANNETSSVEWTKEGRLNYTVVVGSAGDAPYLEHFYEPERSQQTFRWSSTHSRLLLPVAPGKTYALALEMHAPSQAVSEQAGIYHQGKLLSAFKESSVLTAEISSGEEDTVELDLRCKGWVPQKVIKGSGDPRVLGVQLYKISMHAADAPAKVFNANTGR